MLEWVIPREFRCPLSRNSTLIFLVLKPLATAHFLSRAEPRGRRAASRSDGIRRHRVCVCVCARVHASVPASSWAAGFLHSAPSRFHRGRRLWRVRGHPSRTDAPVAWSLGSSSAAVPFVPRPRREQELFLRRKLTQRAEARPLAVPSSPPPPPTPGRVPRDSPVGARRGAAQPSLSLLVLGRAGRGLHLLQSRPALVPSERRFWVTRSTRHGGHSDGCTRPPGDHPSVTWPAGRVRSDPWNFPRRGTPPRTLKPHALVSVCLARRRRRRRCLPPPARSGRRWPQRSGQRPVRQTASADAVRAARERMAVRCAHPRPTAPGPRGSRGTERGSGCTRQAGPPRLTARAGVPRGTVRVPFLCPTSPAAAPTLTSSFCRREIAQPCRCV